MATVKDSQILSAALVGSSSADLLDDAARFAVARRASLHTQELPIPDPAPEQEANQAPPAFVNTLGAINALKPTLRDPLLVEALKLLASEGLVIPTRFIVPLLTLAVKSPSIDAALPQVLGARGHWLAGLDARWQPNIAASEPQPSDWDEGSLAQRSAWLRHIRAYDPAAGRQLVYETSNEKATDRVKYIEALAVGLTLDDQELLESLLHHRSKQVARAAAKLLARLEHSAYLERAVQLARNCLTPKTKQQNGLLDKLLAGKPSPAVATAPEETPDLHTEVVQLGLSPGPVGRLQALVAILPPSRWADAGLTLADLYPHVLLDDEPVNLTAALTAAVIRWPDVDIARVLLKKHPNPDLAALLPPKERDQAIEEILSTADANSLPAFGQTLLHLDGLQLTFRAATSLLDLLGKYLANNHFIAESSCKLLAFATDPAWADGFIPRLTELANHPKTAYLNPRYLNNAVTTLTFRQRLHQSIKEPR